MKKSIITIVAFMLLALASVSAQAADIVIVRVLFFPRETKFHIYQNGSVTEKKYPLYTSSNFEVYTKDLGDLLMVYYKEGYKLVLATNYPDSREYILEKE